MPWWAIVCFTLDGLTIALSTGLIIWYFKEGGNL